MSPSDPLPPVLRPVNSMHEIDYRIHGDDMQFVEIELDPGEATVAEAGGMMYMDDGIVMYPCLFPVWPAASWPQPPKRAGAAGRKAPSLAAWVA